MQYTVLWSALLMIVPVSFRRIAARLQDFSQIPSFVSSVYLLFFFSITKYLANYTVLMETGVPWRQPNYRSGLVTLPSMGAIP